MNLSEHGIWIYLIGPNLKATTSAADLSIKWRLDDQMFRKSKSPLLGLGTLGMLEPFYVTFRSSARKTDSRKLGSIPCSKSLLLSLRKFGILESFLCGFTQRVVWEASDSALDGVTLHHITFHCITIHYITIHYITLHYIPYLHTYILSSCPSHL